MEARCNLISSFVPDECLKQLRSFSYTQSKEITTLGITWTKHAKVKEDGFYRSLGDLGSHHRGEIDLTWKQALCISGDKNSILDLFEKAALTPNFRVNVRPGVFLGFYRKERLLSADSTIVQIRSGSDCDFMGKHQRPSVQKDIDRSDKTWQYAQWTWVDITAPLGLADKPHWGTGAKNYGHQGAGFYLVDPRAFRLPLREAFDRNKWW